MRVRTKSRVVCVVEAAGEEGIRQLKLVGNGGGETGTRDVSRKIMICGTRSSEDAAN